SERTASQAPSSHIIASQSAGSERITSQATGSRHAASESAAHERITSQTSSSQLIASQSRSSERTASRTSGPHFIASQRRGSQLITPQNDGSQHTTSKRVASARIASQTPSSELIASQSGSSEPIASQAARSQIVASQNGSSERAASRTSGPQLIASQSGASQRITPQNDGSRLIASQSAASERTASKSDASLRAGGQGIALPIIDSLMVGLRSAGRHDVGEGVPELPGDAEHRHRAEKARTLPDSRRPETGAARNAPTRHTTDDVRQPEPSTTPVASPASGRLRALLQRTFGFSAFRPHQEAVCEAAAKGEDVLLVMPTGAGKSLCYQLPGIARGGTTLVISPLIALMEDQVASLLGRGLRAERIHSGRERSECRQVLRAYLDGALDFLFIAPERLGVPGFVDQLALRKPTLIAIDEAHCISHWGHDFRPDYRLLGQRLPQLRPTPVIALTATATPIVQKDILEQLGIPRARTFIHGFRRTNLAIEALELPPPERAEKAADILADPARRPAIVYAPSRKAAEELAQKLARRFSTAAYHAGLKAQVRDEIQAKFQRGLLEVIVATIAFGMGVDKADVRTVIHLALPGSIEGYYQEIGRAGRDGKPSRAILLHSFVDRRTHEFFLERDYPDASELGRIHRALRDEPVPREALAASLRMDAEVFEKALEKLWIHGGVEVSANDELRRGRPGWKAPYLAQRARRLEQLEQMGRFAESPICRMLQVLRHFGDTGDDGRPCGQCDVCAPRDCIAARFRPPSAAERNQLATILRALAETDGQSTGRMCRNLLGETPEHRRTFETLLAGLVRGGLIRLVPDTFEKDGRTITFTRAWLTPTAKQSGALDAVLIPEDETAAHEAPRRRRRSRRARSSNETKTTRPDLSSPLAATLKAWRLQEARRRKVPAFRILTDRTLAALARARPSTEEELLQVSGIGPRIAQTYGRQLVALCRG
ncbi:MAG: RecQ family ATP-dependent DNA helicase, partial [Myxococcaceae bacterium]|nr:RecQ family ATP-dependent DNA helicase [Myxococcaceae bacterium]